MTARTRATVAALLVATAAGWLAAAAAPAWAHDALLRTTPADRSTVAAVPAAVLLTFDKPALGLGTAVEILGPAGDAAAGAPILLDTTVREAVRAGSPPGTYTVRWRVTSADGHPVSGSFTFTALAGGGSAVAGPAQPVPGGTRSSAGSSVLWWATAAAGLVLLLVATVALARRQGRPAAAHDLGGRLDE